MGLRARWSALGRAERYRNRCGGEGGDGGDVDPENPLPGFIDPITLQPVVTPAISPMGHVMGLATWKVRTQKASVGCSTFAHTMLVHGRHAASVPEATLLRCVQRCSSGLPGGGFEMTELAWNAACR